MYGFHKISQEDRIVSFSHPQFRRNCKHLLGSIKRKVAKKETKSEMSMSVQDQLQTSIEKLKSRLVQLERRDKDCEWLRSECHKLQ